MKPRQHAYGQDKPLRPLDRFGGWLSKRRILKEAGAAIHGDLADIGCGYKAAISRPFAPAARSLTLVDLELDPTLKQFPNAKLVPGRLPGVISKLKPAGFDVVFLNNVLEHLDEPQKALNGCARLLRKNGVLLVNVPNWLGKVYLEFTAFKLGANTAAEIDDHKTYYDPKDLWPMLVKAGFKPSKIKCYKYKLMSNTFARCQRD